MSFRIFGKSDRNRDGKIISQYPAWFMGPNLEEFELDITERERALNNTINSYEVGDRRIEQYKANLKKDKEKLAAIKADYPDMDKDVANKIRKELANEISPTLFKRTEMMKNLPDCHEEARRMKEPIIEIRGEMLDYAKECFNEEKFKRIERTGKVSRDEASIMFQFVSKYLGEPTNIEYLRKG